MSARRSGRVEMELFDGRVVDLSGLTIEEMVARIAALGITPVDVKATRHFISEQELRDGKARTTESRTPARHERPRD